jgi:hypothetical protein
VLLSKYFEWYHHNVILQLEALLQDTPYEDVVGDYTNYQDFVDTKETLFTPVVQSVESLQEEALEADETDIEMVKALLESQDLSESMDFTKARDNDMFGQPITPVLKCEEDKIDTLILRFPRIRTRRNQDNDHCGSLNYTPLAKEWNSQCLDEMAKPIEHREKM